MTFGQRLRFYRQSRLLTQAELAPLVGVDQRVISRWENDVAKPRAAYRRALCRALGITPDQLSDDQTTKNTEGQGELRQRARPGR